MTEVVQNSKPPKTAKPRKPRNKITLKSSLIYCFNLYLCFLLCGVFIVFGIRDKIALFPMQNTEWKAYLPEMPAKLGVETKELYDSRGLGAISWQRCLSINQAANMCI